MKRKLQNVPNRKKKTPRRKLKRQSKENWRLRGRHRRLLSSSRKLKTRSRTKMVKLPRLRRNVGRGSLSKIKTTKQLLNRQTRKLNHQESSPRWYTELRALLPV